MKHFTKIFALAIVLALASSFALAAPATKAASPSHSSALSLLLLLPLLGAVVGMRGSGSYTFPDERPKNYRDQILLLFPNSAPLLAMSSKLTSRVTDDSEFKILTKDLPAQRITDTSGDTSGATTLTVSDASAIRAGHVLLNERTLELMWVTADPSSPYTSLAVSRGQGGASAAALLAGDGLLVVGNHNAEGSGAPTAIAYNPVVTSNYTQIFKTPVKITGSAAATRMRYGKPKIELKREALEVHGIEIEKAFFFGGAVEATTNGQADRTTKGLLNFITTNVYDASAGFTISGWENFLEGPFKYGSKNKALFAGARLITVANAMARTHTKIEAVPTTESYGVQMNRWLTPFGDVMLINHPLFSTNPTFTSWGFLVDMKQVVYRFLEGRDTDYYENLQAPDVDAQLDQFMTDCGLELDFESPCGVIKTATTFVP